MVFTLLNQVLAQHATNRIIDCVNNDKLDEIAEECAKLDEIVAAGLLNTTIGFLQYDVANQMEDSVADQMEDSVADQMEKNLCNLKWMNRCITTFGLLPQPTKKQARKVLRRVNINIYDLCANRLDKRCSLRALKRDMRQNKWRRFPKKMAKHTLLREFLR